MNEPRPDTEGYRLSRQQADAVLAERRLGRPLLVRGTRRFERRVELPRLRVALERLCARHEILRTAYRDVAGLELPLQFVEATPVYRLRGSPATAGAASSHADEAPESAERAVLTVSVTHVGTSSDVCVVAPSSSLDAGSMQALLTELEAAYEGRDDPDDVLQYVDYSEWQHELVLSEWGEQARSFWSAALRPEALGARLPFEREGASSSSVGSVEIAFHRVSGALEQLTRELGMSRRDALFCAWVAFAARAFGRNDVSVASLVEKEEAELARTLGRFARRVPVPCQLDPQSSVRQSLASIHSRLEECFAWREAFAESALWASGALASLPLGFGYRELPEENDPQRTRVAVDPAELERVRLELLADAAGVTLRLVYREDALERAAAEVWAEQLVTFVCNLAQDLERPLRTVGWLGEAERRRLVTELAGNPGPTPREPRFLHEWFQAAARRDPERAAVVHAGRVLSYASLQRRANQVAHHLRAQGVRSEDVVGVHAGRSCELIVALLGILQAGAAYLPLDPSYPPERSRLMLEDAGVRRVLVHAPAGAEPDLGDAQAISLAEGSPVWRAPSSDLPAAGHPSQLAYMIYTSGSTGKPKGVMVSHANAVASTRARMSFYDWDLECFLLLSSVSFDSSVAGIFWTLSLGGTLCLPEDGEHKDASLVAQLIRRAGVTHFLTLPSFYERLLGELGGSRVRGVIVAGEACPAALARRHFEALPEVALVNEYGPTEGSVWSTAWRLRPGDSGPVPIGGPIESMRAYVLDPALELLPIGATGELFIAGHGITRGYFGRPSLTAERFLPDPHGTPGERMYRTGDQVRFRPDAALEFFGRADQQVKLRGYRIELGEIEGRILEHDEVAEAAVAVRELVAGQGRLVAYVVPAVRAAARDAEVWRGLEERLRAHLSERLPEFMQPAHWVALATFPQTPNGKVDRAALPVPVREAPSEHVAPRDEVERRLAAIWGQVLSVDRVGVHDNFFQLGGDSIVLLQVVALARQQGFALTARDVFGHPSVAELAAFVSAGHLAGPRDAALDHEVQLSPAQRWFFAEHPSNADAVAQWRVYEPAEALEPERLERCLRQLCEHHDGLRLSFTKHPDGSVRQAHVPTQVLHERWAAAPLLESHTIVDEGELGGLVDAARARLRLAGGRLLAALLLTLPARLGGGQRLVLVVHRLVVDAASWQLIADDLGALYRDGERDRMQLSQRTSSLGAWSEALARHATPTGHAGEIEHWQSHLFDARSESFPRDHEHAEYSTELGRAVSSIQGELLDGLLGSASTARRAHVAQLVLSAFARTLCRHGRKSSVVIGVERPRLERPFAGLELGRTVGWLASHHPLRLRPQMRGAGASSSSLAHLKEQLASVPGEGLGYAALKYAREGDAAPLLARAASPRASFSFQDARPRSPDALLAPSTLDIDSVSAGAPGAWLSLDATLLEGRLVLSWVFQRALYEPATIAELARSLEAELDEIVTRAAIEPPAAPSPVDFPLARLTAEELSSLALDWTDVEDIFPLSPMQEGMLLHTLLEPGSGIYLMQDHYQIDSVVDAAQLADAWREVARRHPALRAQFSWQQDGRMLQVIRREPGVPLQLLDHRGLEPDEQQRRLAEELRGERARGFDMASAPLWALRLVQLGDGRYELVISHHHIIMDGWSWGLVWADVCAAYQDALDGKFPPRATPPTYRDFIAWLSAKDPEEAAGYWRGVLAGFEEATPLPFDRAPDAGVSRIDAVRSTWSEAETRALSELSTRHGLTTNTFLQAAWALTLSRYSGRRDVLFGVTVAGRPPELPELQRAVGLFINTIPLRVALPDGRTLVSELLKRLLDQNVEMRAHEHLPLVRIQALGAIPKSEPLFHSVLVYENVPLDSSVLPHAQNLKVRAGASRVHTNYPLTVMILPGRELAIDLSFDERFFERATVARLLGELERLLRALIAGFERPLSELPLAPEAERRALLEVGRGPVRPMPHEQGYARLLLERARRTPERVAARCMGERLTDAQLDHRSAVVAAGLRARGVALEGRVGVLVERGLELLTFAVGVLRAGAVYIPLDPSHPPERLLRTLQRAQVRIVLCSPATAALLERVNDSNEARAIPMWVPTREPSWSASSAAPSDPLYAGPRSVAYVIHTSGSTGEPKGAMVEHAGMLNNVLGKVTDLGLTDTDVVAQTASAAFDISVWQLLTAPLGGARLEVVPDAIAHDPLALLRHVRETGITVLESVPSLIEAMLAETAEALPSLRWMITTGEAMSPDLARRWRERYPSIGLLNAYGPAECADDVALCRIEDASAARLHLPIGRATDNNRLYVLDANLELVPQGATGELCIAGVGPGRGYLDAPAHTARAFVPNPYAESPGERLYRTGDLVRFEPDGHLAFVGRADHQVKIRGYRVELGEIEARLREHPAVKEGVVVAKSGAQGKVLVAYVVPPENAPALPAEIKEQLSRVLPRYMVPAQIVVLERLPLNANGKLDRKALPEPELAADGAREAHAPPITPLEQTIAEIWGEVLGLSRVGRHDDFFELGGHSLLGVQVISRLRRRTGRDIPLRALFEHSELSRFAGSVLESSTAERTAEPPLVSVPRDRALPLSFAQQRLWFLWRIEPESSAYHIPVALRVRGALDRALLERCFTVLVARHESLRTRFVPSDDGVTQVIDALGSLAIEAFDLSRLEHDERERRARELAAEEAARPFDLVHGPLLRVELVALGSSSGADEHLLLVTKHHIISDAESMRVLVDEFLALYEAGGDEHAASLPPVPLQYADYAVWQRRWLADGELGHQLDYWKQRLGSDHPPLELPADRPRPAVMSHAGASLPFEIERELAGRVRAFCSQRGVTPFMFLLASFQLLLFRYTGQRHIRVGVPNANRNRPELERCVGFFVNTHVLGAELAPELRFARLLETVKEAALGAQAHQDLPFEQLVDALNPQRSLSHSPLFQVMFNHQAAERRPLRPLRDLSIEPFEQGLETSQFDLTLDVVEHDGGIRCVFGYATALFDAWRIEQLAAHFVGIVSQAIEHPQRALGEFQLTTRQQAATSTALAAPATAARFVPVRELIRERARAQPAATALACGERTLSYAELDERADALSRELLRRGAGPDVVIGITAARSLDTLVGMLAILGAGGAYLPLDPAAPPARNQAILADAGVRSVLGSSADLAALSLGPDVSTLALDDARPATSTAELPRVREQQLAYVIYTSGSTGRPKGVAVAHGALARHCEAMAARLELDARDRCLHFAAFTFDAALEQWLGPLLVGAQVLVTDGELWSAERTLSELGRRGLTRLDVPPLYLVELARQARERGQSLQVRSCTVGGEALPSEQLGLLLDALDGAPLYNAYGPTEAVITPLVWRAEAARPASAWAPIGTPVGERAALVLDERLEPVPVGVVGELYVSGLLSRGYVGAPAATAASFLPDPFAATAGERMYRTGDLARWRADGSVEYVGRADDQIKLRGFRIEPAEIEAQLLRHPWVRQAAALVRRQEQGHATLVAYVVLDPGAPERTRQPREVSRELQGHLAERLPSYMVPKVFVMLPALPVLASGKLDRRSLPAPVLDARGSHVAPRTALEAQLGALWAETLQVEVVGVEDNFFELGGDSIRAMQVVDRARARGIELAPRQVFQHQTIAALARAIELEAVAPAPPDPSSAASQGEPR